jgi:hypothetical protein
MKKTAALLLCLAVAVSCFAQSSNVQSAADNLKMYNDLPRQRASLTRPHKTH